MGISFYNARGEITAELTGDQVVINLTKELTEDTWVDGEWFGKDMYVLDGEVIPRPECPAALNGLTLEDLPVPCTITIKGQSFECSDATAQLQFNYPGVYVVKVSAWPHLDKEFTVDYSV